MVMTGEIDAALAILVDSEIKISDAIDLLQDYTPPAGAGGIPPAITWTLPLPGDPKTFYSAQNHSATHTGYDLNLETWGDSDFDYPTVSVSAGLCVFSGQGRGTSWGNLVIMQYWEPAGITSFWRYAHLNRRQIVAGQIAQAGQQIGTIGKGYNNRYWAHLHLDAWFNHILDHSTWLQDLTLFFDNMEYLYQKGIPDVEDFIRYNG